MKRRNFMRKSLIAKRKRHREVQWCKWRWYILVIIDRKIEIGYWKKKPSPLKSILRIRALDHNKKPLGNCRERAEINIIHRETVTDHRKNSYRSQGKSEIAGKHACRNTLTQKGKIPLVRIWYVHYSYTFINFINFYQLFNLPSGPSSIRRSKNRCLM